MKITRTETAPHGIKVGDNVREKFGARKFCRVIGLLPFDGSGLEILNGLLEVESLDVLRSRWVLGWGAVDPVVRAASGDLVVANWDSRPGSEFDVHRRRAGKRRNQEGRQAAGVNLLAGKVVMELSHGSESSAGRAATNRDGIDGTRDPAM